MLLDDTMIAEVQLPTRIRNVLEREGLQTVGEVRETTDATFLSFPDFGPGSVFQIRKTLGELGLKAKVAK